MIFLRYFTEFYYYYYTVIFIQHFIQCFYTICYEICNNYFFSSDYMYFFDMLFVLILPINLLRNLRIRVTSTSTHYIHSR